MTRWAYLRLFLLFVVLLGSGCTPKPSGVRGQIKFSAAADAPDYTALEVRVLNLVAQDAGSAAQVFLEGELAATAQVEADGTFQANLRPGKYVLKVLSGERVVTSRMIQVKPNRMTRVNIQVK